MVRKTKKRIGWCGGAVLALAIIASFPVFAGKKSDKPENHWADWMAKHQIYAKSDPGSCTQCHVNANFCIDCHRRRDTVQERVHKRNFKLFHSIQARANPRKCDACHTVDYCQTCHAGRGTR